MTNGGKRVLYVLPGIGAPSLPVKAGCFEDNARVVDATRANHEVDAFVSFYSPDQWDERWLQYASRYFGDMQVSVAPGFVGQCLRELVTPQRVASYDYVLIVLDDVLLSEQFSLAEAIEIVEHYQLDLLAAPLLHEGSTPHPIMRVDRAGGLRRTNFCELFCYLMPTHRYPQYHEVLGRSAKWMWGVDQALHGLGFRMALSDRWPAIHIFSRASIQQRYQGVDEQRRAWARAAPQSLEDNRTLERLNPRPAAVAAAVSAREWEQLQRDGAVQFGRSLVPEPSFSVITLPSSRLDLFRCQRAWSGDQAVELVVIDCDAVAGVDGVTIRSGLSDAIAHARGALVVLIASGACLSPNTLDAVQAHFDRDPGVAILGATVHAPNGSVWSAGLAVQADGTTSSIGRGSHVDDPSLRFARQLDTVDPAFMVFRKQHLSTCFDGAVPDLPLSDVAALSVCRNARAAGFRVAFEPGARVEVLRDVELSAIEESAAIPAWHKGAEVSARAHLLFVLERTPNRHLGSRFVRSIGLIRAAVELGCCISLLPRDIGEVDWATAYLDLPDSVEIIESAGTGTSIDELLSQRPNHFSHVFVESFRVLKELAILRRDRPALLDEITVVFDLSSWQDDFHASGSESATRLSRCKELARTADVLIASVSGVCELINRHWDRPVHFVGESVAEVQNQAFYPARSSFVISQVIPGRDSLAAAAVHRFVADVWPLVVGAIPTAQLHVIGRCDAPQLLALGSRAIHVHDEVRTPDAILATARVGIDPRERGTCLMSDYLQFARHGVPMVTTAHFAGHLGLGPFRAIVADTPEAWAQGCIRLHGDAAVWQQHHERVVADAVGLEQEARQALAQVLFGGSGEVA